MVNTLDITMPALALRLITQYGASVTIQHMVAGAYDPTTSIQTEVISTLTTSGVVEEYAEGIRFLGDKLGSSGIIEGDKKVSIPASGLSFVPVPGDKLTVGGITFGIIGVASAWSGQNVALYALHVRRA